MHYEFITKYVKEDQVCHVHFIQNN